MCPELRAGLRPAPAGHYVSEPVEVLRMVPEKQPDLPFIIFICFLFHFEKKGIRWRQ